MAATSSAADLRSWWLLPVLFAVWVNVDNWFLLGPLVVGLYWLGEFIQQQLQPRDVGPRARRPVLSRRWASYS